MIRFISLHIIVHHLPLRPLAQVAGNASEYSHSNQRSTNNRNEYSSGHLAGFRAGIRGWVGFWGEVADYAG